MQNSGSLSGLSGLLCESVSALCSGDKEAEGVLPEAGHGGAGRYQRRSLQHEDPPGPAKRYGPPLTCPTGPTQRDLCSVPDPSGSVLEHDGSGRLLYTRVCDLWPKLL